MAMRIGEVARRAGLAPSAIRYYEREGLLPPAERRGQTRVYGEDVFDRLALVRLARRAGFTVAETRRILGDASRRTRPGPRWREHGRAKRRELEARIAEAERMRALLHALERCTCASFKACARAASAADERPD